MASRPRPRVRRKLASLDVDADNIDAQGTASAFILGARRSPAPAIVANDTEPLDSDDDPTRTRRRKKALSFTWVSQPTLETTPEVDAESAVQASGPEPTSSAPAPQDRSRSCSVSPPPPEIDKEAESYARWAMEQVHSEHRRKLAELQVAMGPEHEDTSSDVSFELNADLAQYYRGQDAHKLRERAIALARERAEPQASTYEVVDDTSSPARAPVVYTIDDSSDDDVAAAVPPSSPPLPPPPPAQTAVASSPHDTRDDDTLLLTLRGARQLEVQVRVHATTQVSTMLAHFVQTHAPSLADAERTSAYLSLEGERLPSTNRVEDLDVEDGDMIDVMW